MKDQFTQRKQRFKGIEFIKRAKNRFDARRTNPNVLPNRRKHRPFQGRPDLINYQPKSKYPESSPVNELLKAIEKKDIKGVKTNLDKIWRKPMITGKDHKAIEAAQEFLREVDSRPS